MQRSPICVASKQHFAIGADVYEIPSVTPTMLSMDAASEKRRTYVIKVGRPIPSDVDGIVFSSDVTCMASNYFVRVNRLCMYRPFGRIFVGGVCGCLVEKMH